MADEKKLKQINKFAILIHQLQSKDKNAALSYFSEQSIEKVSCRSEGLYIFFKEYDLVVKSIRRRKIEVEGLFYKIYYMVTNITICGIGPYVTNSIVDDIMQSYGFIIDSYRVRDTREHNGCKTVSLTNDYRIILDVPEVYAPNLTPIRLPNITNRTFKVLFFCRLCRRNGHMQFQCLRDRKNSSSSRQMSWENTSSDEQVNNSRINRPRSDFCIHPQKSKIYSNSPMKIEKRQNDFSEPNCSSENTFHKNDTLKSCSHTHSKSKPKPTYSKSKNCYNVHKIAGNMDIPKKCRQDHFSSTRICNRRKFENNNPSSSKRSSTEFIKKRSSEKKNFHQHRDCVGEDERIQASTSYKCNAKQTTVVSNKRKKIKFMSILSSVLPPNTDLLKIRKLIKIAFKCKPEDIPGDVKAVLVTIQKYNRRQRNEDDNVEVRAKFLHWINGILSKMKPEKVNKEKGPVKPPIMEQERIKDEKSITEISKQQSSRKRKISLSSGIREAISKTAGELQPVFLCNFLNQVRGRKKFFEVATIFTQNIPGLASQLLEVQNTYYKYVRKRGPEEDRDINYIKRLRLRLLQHCEHATKTSVKEEADMTEVHFKTEPDLTEGHVKTESDVTETTVKVEPDTMEMSVNAESHMEIESDVTNASMQSKTDMSEIAVKSETEIFMKQSSNDETFVDKNFSHNLYTASYFTNVTRMPFSLDYIKTEVDDID